MICLQCRKEQSVRKSSFCAQCNRKNLYRRNKLKAIQLKGGKCQLCLYDRSTEALDFHHVDPSTKRFAISQYLHNWKKILPELDKCILLCKNCHAERHAVDYIEETYCGHEMYDFIIDEVEIDSEYYV